MTRTRSSHTVAPSFNMKAVPERIGADSPSGFEVAGGRGAGRAWGVEALSTAGTTSNDYIAHGGEIRQEKQEMNKSVLKWFGGGLLVKEKVVLQMERVRTSISAGE